MQQIQPRIHRQPSHAGAMDSVVSASWPLLQLRPRSTPTESGTHKLAKRPRGSSLEMPIHEDQQAHVPAAPENLDSKHHGNDSVHSPENPPPSFSTPKIEPLQAPQVTTPQDLDGIKAQDFLDYEDISFGPNHIKTIYRWMRKNNARIMSGHRTAFLRLLETLGFTNPAFSPKLQRLLYVKLLQAVATYGAELKNNGVITVTREGKKETVQFADWTECWEHQDWDGNVRSAPWMDLFLKPNFDDPLWVAGQQAPAIIGVSEISIGPEILDVEEHQEDRGMESNEGASDWTASYYDTDDETIGPEAADAQSGEPSILKYRPSYLVPLNQWSRPNYRIELSEMHQYQNMQLTPNDPSHPLRPHPSFMTAFSRDIDVEDYCEDWNEADSNDAETDGLADDETTTTTTESSDEDMSDDTTLVGEDTTSDTGGKYIV